MTYILKHVSNHVRFRDGTEEVQALNASISQGSYPDLAEPLNRARVLQAGGASGKKAWIKDGNRKECQITANFRIDGGENPVYITFENGNSIVTGLV